MTALALVLLLLPASPPKTTERTMSTYHDMFVGREMSNGRAYSHGAATVASNDFPLGTELRLSYGGRSLKVEVTDRMAERFTGSRIDASRSVWGYLTKGAPPGLRKVKIEET